MINQEDAGGPKLNGAWSKQNSWAEILSRSLPSRWQKNVLEVILEKDTRGSFNVSHEECAKFLNRIGIDSKPGVHVEEVQICPNGRGTILITLKKDVPINQFCRHDVVEVSKNGVRATNVKPVNKREVIINLRNLHPNTRDKTVINYLNKFGKVISNKVVYGLYKEGPLKGFRNGDRAYKLDIKPGVNIGTYHVLEGQKVTARYSGQFQT